jgi:hypothetical protein
MLRSNRSSVDKMRAGQRNAPMFRFAKDGHSSVVQHIPKQEARTQGNAQIALLRMQKY